MGDTWLLIDCNYLCHRARYTMDELSHNGQPTEIAYGFLSEVLSIQKQFDALYPVFCWDMGVSIRRDHYTPYKAQRQETPKNLSEEELGVAKKEARRFRKSTRDLRVHILPSMGYGNVLMSPRIESDDWIAKAALEISEKHPKDSCVIVTADHDMFQCLTEKVSMYDPRTRKETTYHSFVNDYKILPSRWADVKAYAGCISDNVRGVQGIGEKTAIQFLRNKLKPESKKAIAINSRGSKAIHKRNLKLVTLPWHETPEPNPHKSLPNERQWREGVRNLGMVTLLKIGPYTGVC